MRACQAMRTSGTIHVESDTRYVQKSRKKESWRDPLGTRASCKTQDDAIQEIQKIRGDILAEVQEKKPGMSIDNIFARFASDVSDCKSAKKGGALGAIVKGKMHKDFETAALRLSLQGESCLSAPVLTDSGVHLILRIR